MCILSGYIEGEGLQIYIYLILLISRLHVSFCNGELKEIIFASCEGVEIFYTEGEF